MTEVVPSRALGRYGSLQIGRGIAALLVVLHHTVGRAQVAGLSPGAGFGFGFLGVDYFFVLSGFIIAHSLSRPQAQVGNFLWRRAVRLLPVFWLVFAVSGLAVWVKPSLLGHPVHYSVAELGKAFLLLRQDIADGRSNPPIVGVAWTLHHEVLFYAFAALWLWRPRWGLVLGALVVFGSLGRPESYPATYLLNPLNLEFAFGVLAYLAHRKLPVVAAWGVAAGGALALPLAWQWWQPLDELVNQSRVWSAGLPLALLVCAMAALEKHGSAPGLHKGGATRWRKLRDEVMHSLERLGDCSYALYLTHYPVMLLCLKSFRSLVPHPSLMTLLLYYLVTVGVAVFASAVLHFRFEQPVQRWMARLLRRDQIGRQVSAT